MAGSAVLRNAKRSKRLRNQRWPLNRYWDDYYFTDDLAMDENARCSCYKSRVLEIVLISVWMPESSLFVETEYCIRLHQEEQSLNPRTHYPPTSSTVIPLSHIPVLSFGFLRNSTSSYCNIIIDNYVFSFPQLLATP